MGTTRTAGFTILETMLFLAITGLLIVTLLAGVGTSINVQRYKDSVATFESLLQQQYSDLVNVSNDENSSPDTNNQAQVDTTWKCESDGTVTDTNDSTGGVPRGQSNCVLLGRYMQVDGQGNVTIEQVTGLASSTTATYVNDIQSLEDNYSLGLSDVNTSTSQLEWGATLAWPVSGHGIEPVQTGERSIGMLFLQSPDSGTIYTFTVDTPPAIADITSADLLKFIQPGDTISQPYNGATLRGQDERVMCIQNGTNSSVDPMAVYLNPYASNATAVESQSNELLATLKSGALQC